jgi:predicted nucleic acid-binding protein
MATAYLPDTSCLVALVCQWHEHHDATRQYMKKLRSSAHSIILSAHSLLETYSVLTRLPVPYRLSEATALKLIETNWTKNEVVSLTSDEYWKLLRNVQRTNVSGGRVYDALVAACARKGKAKFILTWNPQHFMQFQNQSLEVRTPTL